MKYFTIAELTAKTGLHRQTVYNKVKALAKAKSDQVRLDDGVWLSTAEPFSKYIVERNTEEVESEAVGPSVIQLSERVYEDLVKERDDLKREVRTLYERVLDSENRSKQYEALYGATRGDISQPKAIEAKEPALVVEKPLEAPKTPRTDVILLTVALSILVVVVVFVVLVVV